MKKLLLLFLPLLLVLSTVRGQTIQYQSAVPHTTGTPSGAPSTYGSWLRYDKTNKILYRWTGSAWTASLPGAVADGDKGDITVSGSGTNWQIGAGAVANAELAAGTGGFYKGSGTIPSGVGATVTDEFAITRSGGGDFRVNDTGAHLYAVNAGEPVEVAATSDGVIFSRDGTGDFGINSTGIIVDDTRATPRGVQYSADYSTTYDDRSLVDKAYVVAQNATNANLTGPVTSVGNATTITADAVGASQIAADAVGSSEIAASAVGASEITSNAVDSTKVAASGLSPSDIGPSGASIGQVMTYTSNGWRPAAAGGAVSDGDKGDITVSGSGATWDIDASAVGSSEIAANAIDSTKVAASSLSPSDIGPSGASVGQVMAYTSNGWRPRGGRATLGSNVTTTSGSLVDATGLSFSVESGATYYFRATILHQSTSTAIGVALAHNGPALTSLATMVMHPTSNTTFQQVQQTAYDTNVALSTSMSAANTNYVSISEGYITCSASGTFIIRFRAEVAGTQVQISANSFIDYLKL